MLFVGDSNSDSRVLILLCCLAVNLIAMSFLLLFLILILIRAKTIAPSVPSNWVGAEGGSLSLAALSLIFD